MQFYQCGLLRTERDSQQITTYYRETECPIYGKSVYQKDSKTETVTFFGRDGSAHSIARPIAINRDGSLRPLCDVYNAQYGIAVSFDGRYFYLSHWEGGVYCFSVQDFSLVWKNTLGSVRHIFTTADGNEVYCSSYYHGLLALRTSDGSVCGKVAGAEKKFFRLDESLFLVGIKRGAFHTYRFDDLSLCGKIRVAEIINDGQEWCFRNAWLEEGQIKFDAFSGNRSEIFSVPFHLQ